MPWLRKKPFQRLHVSSDYRDDDEVFHCEVTNEIFKDYNEFCERIILCNSTIWSCSITGKTNMTYEEAFVCEENAKESLKEFPMELRIPILYLASKMNRSSFSDMMEDIYQFARDRYFVGEMVEACFKDDTWCDCHILQVIEPTEEQINTYNNNEKQQNLQDNNKQYNPPAKLFNYEVEQLDCGDDDVTQLHIIDATKVRRKKQLFTRERCKIFLRMLCEQNNQCIWIVKDEIQRKYGIQKIRFDTIFAGPIPNFSAMPKRPVIKQQKQITLDRFLTNDVTKQQQQQQNSRPLIKTDPLRKLNDTGLLVKKKRRTRINGKFKEAIKAKALQEKEKKKEERIQIREKQKEEKLKLAALAAYVREWNKPREDLECEDLRQIPTAIPVNFKIPNNNFGNFIMILEFLQFFEDELEVKSYFTNGVTIDILEKSMLIKEASGPWSDLLQLLLANIFKYQAEEEDEIHESNSSSNDINATFMDHKVSSMAEAVKLATIASSWSQTQHGCQLSELTLDHVTLSEILRQHLLSSGGRIGDVASKWRYSQRGGYTNHDDPALYLRINESRILRCLGHRSVCEFNIDDRLCITTCLINQLLTFASIRDVIEERHDKIHQAKRELKLYLLAEQKKEKEEKEKERLKEKEKDKDKDDTNTNTNNKLIINDDNNDKQQKKTRGSSREEDKKRDDYENKIIDLRLATKDEQMMVYLGSDRAYRRYWRFISIPGLFVENEVQYSNKCLPDGTPYLPELLDKDAADIYLKNKFEDELSDKENTFNKNKKNNKSGGGGKLSTNKKDDIRRNLMACTDSKDCPVHCKRSSVTWSFFSNENDIDNLIQNLNIRGIREGELKNNLINEIDSIKSIIKNCPIYKLNPDIYPPENYINNNNNNNNNNKNKKTKIENTNLNFPPEMKIDEVMELTLRDYVLDLEDKIKAGCLGSLKVKDRELWRREITNPTYTTTTDEDVATNSLVDKIKMETRSRPGTPDSEVGSGSGKLYRDPGKYLGPPGDNDIQPDIKQQNSIKQMAKVILQLLHAIEPKYLKKPLGNDEKDKKSQLQQQQSQQQQSQAQSQQTQSQQHQQQQQQQQQHHQPHNVNEELIERWEQSLLASTSWSQLFLHLSTMENSVAWGRSALNARCRICRKCRDAENMLLCDGCNKGQHLYCLKPKLTSVPEGDWYCSICKPKETKPKNKKSKTRKNFEDEDDDETVITKFTKNRLIDDEDEDEDDNNNDDDDNNEKHLELYKTNKKQELCSGCGSTGNLIACDTCPKLYHLDCIEPQPLSRAPRGRWSCFNCKNSRKSAPKIVKGREREKETERSCAAAARTRIHGFAKSLLSTDTSSWWDDTSNSEETETRQTRRSAKRAAAVQDKSLHELLKDVMHHRDSWPFLSPVTIDEVPDYYDFIKKPMDFGTIKKKLDNGNYEKNSQLFFNDIQLIFDNCHAYNKEHSAVYKAGIRLSKYFDKKSKDMGINCGDEVAVTTTRRSGGSQAKKFKEDSEHNKHDSTDKQIKINGNR
ncbi:bromodomain adjacent to zinc finger domain protein 1A isoform X2 [Aphidius gifuensis]|uniref:bromodomain adjacent to zinc finger domain protein 1A isoform X2 n=1 Tax=Aphidius gifuensis TaxID=684658 RepID=UPI001CDD595F|nr:bromodomain adjacent to zinc finger domain protein 1A isoform X2 [Aphidius gifuensis]